MSQKFTVLLDLDGTLVHSAPDLMSAHNFVMKKFGYKERNLSDIRKLAGRGSKVMLLRSMHDLAELTGKETQNEKELDLMTKEFINFYSNNICEKSTLRSGVIEFLDWCKKNSISMAVCTNKQEHLSIDLLKKIKIYNYFEYVAGGNTFNCSKPDPKHLTNTIEILGGNIKKTIMIGDSETDSKAALNAKIPFVLIDNGYTEKKPNQIHYDYLEKDFFNLKNIILKLIDD